MTSPGAFLVRVLSLALMALAGALSACAIVDNVSEDGMEGYLSFGFEEAAFRPCGNDEQWWVEADPSIELAEAYSAIADSSYQRLYARLVGSRSGLGDFGHLGAYDRVFTVSRIVEIRRAEEGDCVWPGGPTG